MIDLHTHSYFSDGSESPARVVELAKRAGLSAIALTDHDRLDGLEEASKKATELGITLVAGCELSCVWKFSSKEKEVSCHMLIYFVDMGIEPLSSELLRLQNDRDTRNERLIGKLNELGFEISIEEVSLMAKGQGIGRPHFAQALVNHGYVQSVQDAFDQILGSTGKAYIPKARLTPEDAINLANASGGVAVVAHPLFLVDNVKDLVEPLRELRSFGLVGLESYYGRYTKSERQALVSLARDLDLVPTGGSDYHGSYKPDLNVGTGLGDLKVPDQVLEELVSRRAST
ncbi:MAG: PHP domain-containing protein [Acidimicrobiales bacterium]|nr:PHP domain-containing protein [Acidimicrobiales bacterium]